MDSSVYANKEFVKASKRWVCVYGSNDTGHGTAAVDGKEMCKLHPQITCEEHVKVDADASGKFFSGDDRDAGDGLVRLRREGSRQAGRRDVGEAVDGEDGGGGEEAGARPGSDEYWYALDRIAAGEKSMGRRS